MSSTRTVAIVVGTRPNFVKLRPLRRAIAAHPGLQPVVIHTGQHHDEQLFGRFFRELQMDPPDVTLSVAPGSRSRQLADMVRALEPPLRACAPDWVVVIGDVNSTLAGALTARHIGVPLAHVEAGLRNGCPKMVEELNRRLTDAMSQLHFVTEQSAVENLRREGIAPERVRLVGNVLVDALDLALAELPPSPGSAAEPAQGIVTLHRPENVEDEPRFRRLLELVAFASSRIPLLFPVHPRTAAALERLGADNPLLGASVKQCAPLGYLQMVSHLREASLVLTDSGGLQEETTALGIPCLTLRPSTERPATVEVGSNWIVDDCRERLERALDALLQRETLPSTRRPPLWDGQASERIAAGLAKWNPTADNMRW